MIRILALVAVTVASNPPPAPLPLSTARQGDAEYGTAPLTNDPDDSHRK